MLYSLRDNFTSHFHSQYFRDSEKEFLIEAFDKISIKTESVSTKEELTEVLNQISKIDLLYRAYLKKYNCFMRFIINICWWKSSVHGACVACRHTLAKRVAAGYENKMMSLVVCKYFLKDKNYRLFCDEALQQAIRNTHQRKDVKGFLWKVINKEGIASYLVGTTHKSTGAVKRMKGLVNAIQCSEKFFTEIGPPESSWLNIALLHLTSLMKKKRHFSFCVDSYIALEGLKKNKENFTLDNFKLREEAEKIEKIQKQNSEEQEEIDLKSLFKEIPEKQYFENSKINVNVKKSFFAENKKILSYHLANLYDKGDESEIKDLIPCSKGPRDHRTESWVKRSFKSYNSETSYPGLIQQIKEANKSICIAVGIGHCIGPKGLVNKFKNAGFEVSRFE